MSKETIDILGRNYMLITRAEAEHLEFLRQDSFLGAIDANTCESESYKFIFTDGISQNVTGVIKRNSGQFIDLGTVWVANHLRKTLTYDGVRSLRIAEALKYLNDEYPCLLGKKEYEDLITYYSKFFGPFFNRNKNNEVSEEEFITAKETIEVYETQLLYKRRARKPKFGDVVRCACSASGRYIGNGQAIFVSAMCNEISRDLVDMDADWNSINDIIPSDSDLVKFLKENDCIDE